MVTDLAQRHVPVDPKIKLGSGGRFRKLKSKLAARGARNPGALAAYIGRRAYGRKRFAALGAKGRASSHSNIAPALEFAMTSLPAVTSPYDVMIVRADDGGGAVIRHRRGGGEIGSIKRTDAGWVATRAGRDLGPHTRQRGALLELIGTHNRSAGTPFHRPVPEGARKPLETGPVQTPLMERFGIPAISTLANSAPAVGASDGSRETSGLSSKGAAIYKKLRKRNFPHERAHNFARRAQARAARG